MSQQGRLIDQNLETLTGDAGGPVSPDGTSTINIVGGTLVTVTGNPGTSTLTIDASSGGFPITPYVVGPVGEAGYTTVQAGLDAANAASGGIVYVQPGTYTEDLTLYDGTQVVSAGLPDTGDGVEIIGLHTPPAAGGFVFRNVRLTSATDVLSSAVAGTAYILIANSEVNVTNGYLLNLPNWTGTLELRDVNEAALGTNDGCVNNSGGSLLLFFNGSYGVGNGNTMIVSGTMFTDGAKFFAPINFQTGSALGIQHSNFFNLVTALNNARGTISNCTFQSTGAGAFTMSSASSISITNCMIDTTNNPAIDGAGAGTLTLTGIDFVRSSTIAATLTIAAGNSYSGTYKSDYTDHGVILGQGAISDMVATSAGTDGQILIGATGADPAFANLTSNLNTIEITEGANTLDIALTQNVEATAVHGWNGSMIESADVTVTSTGTAISCNIEQAGGGDLTVVFSDDFYDWDTTPPATIALTAGTDVAPQINFVYLLQSTKTLTASTAGWPTTEYAAIATVICQSAASLQTEGAYKLHAWTDHVTAPDNQGMQSHLNFWIRSQNATWLSGVTQTYTITPQGAAPDNVLLTTLAGSVLQLHHHVYPAFAGTPDYYVINDSVAAYDIVNDLNALLTDSAGGSMAGKFFSLVIWGVVSEDTGDCKIFVNLPGGSYNTSAALLADSSTYANFTIPADYVGTGFLISQWQLRHNAAASGTWTSIGEIDLRGLVPSISPSGSTASPVEFADNTFRIFDDGDDTKEIAFQASAITPANTRTITMTDKDLDLAQVADAFVTDAGTATPVNNSLNIVGGAGGITTTAAGATITINAAGSALTWTEIVGVGPTAMVEDNGYITNNVASVGLTLPATATLGSVLQIVGKGAGGWDVVQGAGQTIHFLAQDTTTGAGGSLASTTRYDCITLRCIIADTDWTIENSAGNITVV